MNLHENSRCLGVIPIDTSAARIESLNRNGMTMKLYRLRQKDSLKIETVVVDGNFFHYPGTYGWNKKPLKQLEYYYKPLSTAHVSSEVRNIVETPWSMTNVLGIIS